MDWSGVAFCTGGVRVERIPSGVGIDWSSPQTLKHICPLPGHFSTCSEQQIPSPPNKTLGFLYIFTCCKPSCGIEIFY